MHEIETALTGITAIRNQMAGRAEFGGYDGSAVPNTAAAGRAGASL